MSFHCHLLSNGDISNQVAMTIMMRCCSPEQKKQGLDLHQVSPCFFWLRRNIAKNKQNFISGDDLLLFIVECGDPLVTMRLRVGMTFAVCHRMFRLLGHIRESLILRFEKP